MTELEAIPPHSTELTLKFSIAPSDVGHALGLSQTTLFCLHHRKTTFFCTSSQPLQVYIHGISNLQSTHIYMHGWIVRQQVSFRQLFTDGSCVGEEDHYSHSVGGHKHVVHHSTLIEKHHPSTALYSILQWTYGRHCQQVYIDLQVRKHLRD